MPRPKPREIVLPRIHKGLWGAKDKQPNWVKDWLSIAPPCIGYFLAGSPECDGGAEAELLHGIRNPCAFRNPCAQLQALCVMANWDVKRLHDRLSPGHWAMLVAAMQWVPLVKLDARVGEGIPTRRERTHGVLWKRFLASVEQGSLAAIMYDGSLAMRGDLFLGCAQRRSEKYKGSTIYRDIRLRTGKGIRRQGGRLVLGRNAASQALIRFWYGRHERDDPTVELLCTPADVIAQWPDISKWCVNVRDWYWSKPADDEAPRTTKHRSLGCTLHAVRRDKLATLAKGIGRMLPTLVKTACGGEDEYRLMMRLRST